MAQRQHAHAEEVNALQSRIAELETTLQEIHQHYDDVHAEEINALNARIAELEGKLMQCPRCGDPITNELGDNPICGACALASELNVKTLQERVAELEAENAIFRNADYDALQSGSRIAELEAEQCDFLRQEMRRLLEKQGEEA